MKVKVKELWHRNAYGIWLMEERNNRHYIAKPCEIILEAIKEGEMFPEPTFTIDGQIAQPLLQSLVNELVKQGIRPDTDKLAGLLEAQTKHLEDMRKLVFK